MVLTPERLELRETGPQAAGAVYVDFASGRYDHRRRFGGGRGQEIARAAGLKGGRTPDVTDATAGLGADAFVLASLGCTLRLIERRGPVAALLRDGLERARNHPDPELSAIAARMTLLEGDAAERLPTLDPAPSVVYLDPMYPAKAKTSLPKKEMRLFHTLVGPDLDSGRLLTAALEVARYRVVVKRPAGAPPLAGPKPSAAVQSKNTRFDLYVKAALD
nr:class I SAM-dependent methyltransferase [Deinobacterium chartae]